MTELIIFVGLQGSGKTTWYHERLAATHVHVSKDLMHNVRDRETRQRQQIAVALGSGRDVVVDNTNATPTARAALIEIGREHGARVIACHFDTPVAVCVARNRVREGKARVPDVAIFVTSKKLVPPSVDEGFDEVRVIPCTPAT